LRGWVSDPYGDAGREFCGGEGERMAWLDAEIAPVSEAGRYELRIEWNLNTSKK